MAFLKRHVWYPHGRGTKAVGFKLLYDQFIRNRRALKPMIDDTQGVKVIHLKRCNVFDIYLSTKNFHRVDDAGRPYRLTGTRPPPLRVDPVECRAFLERHDLSQSIVDAQFDAHRTLSLNYEDLVADPQAENARICEFLGVENRPLHHELRKLSRGRLRDKVANLHEVQRHFGGSKWAWMVQDEPDRAP